MAIADLRKLFGVVLFCTPLGAQTTVLSDEVTVQRFFGRQPVPNWANGYFLGFEIDPARVYAYKNDGSLLFDNPLTFEDACNIMPSSIAASVADDFVVSGSFYSCQGEGTTFIAFLNSKGGVRKVVRLNKFAPLHVAYAPDGRLWVAGRATNYPSLEDPPDHDVLRVYNHEGTLLASSLRRSTFPKSRTHPSRSSRLAVNENLVVYVTFEQNELVASRPDGQLAFRKRFDPLGKSILVTGLALNEASDIYLSAQVRRKPDPNTEDVVFYKWNNTTGKWDEVFSRVLGRDIGYHSIFGFAGNVMLVSMGLPRFKWLTDLP